MLVAPMENHLLIEEESERMRALLLKFLERGRRSFSRETGDNSFLSRGVFGSNLQIFEFASKLVNFRHFLNFIHANPNF